MVKYNVENLFIVKKEKIKYICMKINTEEYEEIFTNKIIKMNDKLDINPLSDFYKLEVIKSYINESPLFLTKDELLIKFANVNAYSIYTKSMINYMNDVLDEQEEYLKLFNELSIKNPEKAKEIAKLCLKNSGILDENNELNYPYDKVFEKSDNEAKKLTKEYK